MTQRYEEANKNAPTIVRKATPEENQRYMELLEKAKKETNIYEKEQRRRYLYGNKV